MFQGRGLSAGGSCIFPQAATHGNKLLTDGQEIVNRNPLQQLAPPAIFVIAQISEALKLQGSPGCSQLAERQVVEGADGAVSTPVVLISNIFL